MHALKKMKIRNQFLVFIGLTAILFLVPYIILLVAYLGNSADTAKFAAALRVAMPIAGIVLAAVTVFSLVFVATIGKRSAGSIIKIGEAMHEFAQGKIRVHIDCSSSDEIGALTQSINQFSDQLSGAVGEVIRILNALASGDLTVGIDREWIGDWADLNKATKNIISSLNSIFEKVNTASEQTTSGSEQVASAAQALAQGATEQASSIQELSATIMEISEHVKKNASNATEADQASALAKDKVGEANTNMNQMMEAMTQISDASQKIGNIIKTINDIAFQTNILALNAAVEAARAGSAGKGFAVVADEVRNLASKSAEAAKDTTSLIEESIRAVTNGSKIAEVTEKTLAEVHESTVEVNKLVNEIASATNQQATSIGQINQGVQQISAVVQTNSATAEESAAASEELAAQAKSLKHSISGIRLKGQAASPAAKPTSAQPAKPAAAPAAKAAKPSAQPSAPAEKKPAVKAPEKSSPLPSKERAASSQLMNDKYI